MDWNWLELTLFLVKTIVTLIALVIAIYACILTLFWRGWILVTAGLAVVPFIGTLQILNSLSIPEKDYWNTWTNVVLPFISMSLVSMGTWEVVKQIRRIVKKVE